MDWECLLPMCMLAYNTHVHRSTGETPFFLTFLHDPRLPTFDVQRPRKFNHHGWVEDAYVTMESVYRVAQSSMAEASERSKAYFDKKAKSREFRQGDKILVFYPNVPPGQNQKFYTKWRPFTVLKRVGRLNVYCQPEDRQGKPSLIHVDRVIHRQAEEGPRADEAPTVAPPSSPPSPHTPRAGPVTRAQTRRTAGAVQVS